MFNKRYLYQLIFAFFVCLQVATNYMHSIDLNINNIMFAKFTLFEIALLLAYIIASFGVYKYLISRSNDPNKLVISLILIYTLYQYIVLVPIHFFHLQTSNKDILYFALWRSVFLVILFLYWYGLPAFKSIKSSYRWLEYSSIAMLGLLALAYSSGQFGHTSTGEVRIGSGTTSMLFAFVLIANFSLLSGNKNNVIFILVGLLGIVFANHRSAYLAVGLIILISLLNSDRIKNKSRIILQMAIVIVAVLIPLSQIDLIRESFTGRVSTSLDYKDPNALDRYIYFGLAWEYFIDNPINGSMRDNHFYHDRSYEKISPPHSFIFQLLPTQGLVGFGLLMAIMTSLLIIAYKNRKDIISFQMFLLLIFYLSFSLLNITFLNQSNVFILLFCAAVIVYRNKQIKDNSTLLAFLLFNNNKNKKDVDMINKSMQLTH